MVDLSPAELLLRQRELLSQSLGGRGDLFTQFLAGRPETQFANPLTRRVLENQFGPLSANFVLNTLTGQGGNTAGGQPGTPSSDFRSFLNLFGGTQPGGGTRGFNFGDRFKNLADILPRQAFTTADPAGGGAVTTTPRENFADFQERSQGFSLEDQARLGVLFDDPQGGNIITQAATQGLSPLLRPFAQQALTNRFNAFRDEDLTTPLFARFAQQGFRF